MTAEQQPALQLMFGGTFDPIHHGHLRMAVELRETLEEAVAAPVRINLIPAHLPPHRGTPGAAADHRWRMLELAVEGEPGLRPDRRELRRSEPSWSVDTLAELRRELGPGVPLVMALGTDSFASIDRWHRWREILDLAHVLVLQRPGHQVRPGTEAARLLSERGIDEATGLLSAPGGSVFPLSLSLLAISATDIRNRIAAGRSPRYLLPDAVWRYICQHALYTQ